MLNEIGLIPFVTEEGEKTLVCIPQIIAIREVGTFFQIRTNNNWSLKGPKDKNIFVAKLMELFHAQRFVDMIKEVDLENPQQF